MKTILFSFAPPEIQLLYFFLINFFGCIFALQCCVSFCCRAKWTSRACTFTPLFWTSFSFRSSQSTDQTSLCYTACSRELSVSHMVSVVCMCPSLSPNASQFPSPPWCPYIRSLHLCLSLFPLCKQNHLYHFSRFHMYVFKCDFFFLSF